MPPQPKTCEKCGGSGKMFYAPHSGDCLNLGVINRSKEELLKDNDAKDIKEVICPSCQKREEKEDVDEVAKWFAKPTLPAEGKLVKVCGCGHKPDNCPNAVHPPASEGKCGTCGGIGVVGEATCQICKDGYGTHSCNDTLRPCPDCHPPASGKGESWEEEFDARYKPSANGLSGYTIDWEKWNGHGHNLEDARDDIKSFIHSLVQRSRKEACAKMREAVGKAVGDGTSRLDNVTGTIDGSSWKYDFYCDIIEVFDTPISKLEDKV